MRRNTKLLIARRLIFALVILLTHILQNSTGLVPTVFGARAFLLIPLSVCIAMFEKELAGALLGLFAGALWDSVSGTADGYYTFFFMLVGAVCGFLINVLMRNHLLTALILCALTSLAFSAAYVLFFVIAGGVDSGGYLFLRYYLPSCLYTELFVPLFYLLVREIMRRTATEDEI